MNDEKIPYPMPTKQSTFQDSSGMYLIGLTFHKGTASNEERNKIRADVISCANCQDRIKQGELLVESELLPCNDLRSIYAIQLCNFN